MASTTAHALPVLLSVLAASASAQATEEAKLLAPDGAAGDVFGIHVALDGDTALVGAPRHDEAGTWSGAAYVFVRGPAGWSPQAELIPLDAAAGDGFGVSVALEGDLAVVGAWDDDDLGADSGSAYVFRRAGGVWAQEAKLLASDGSADDDFGLSVAISGDTVLVAAQAHDALGTDSGAVYVFVRSGGAWTQQAELTASDGGDFHQLGILVDLEGDTAVAGAHLADGLAPGAGAAYVFTRSGTTWTEQAKLLAPDGSTGDRFGKSVSLDGQSLLVGAYHDADNGFDAGSAYVFTRAAGVWSLEGKLLAPDGEPGDLFGDSVSLRGERCAVSAARDDDVASDAGSLHVFSRQGGVWTPATKLVASDASAGAAFGLRSALDGNRVLIGSHLDDAQGVDSGSAYVVLLDVGPLVYCTAKASSLGCAPSINGPSASASLGAGSGGYDVRVGPVPGGPGNPAILIYSSDGPLASPALGPYGYLCITPGPGFFRVLPPVLAGGSTGQCNGLYQWDFGFYLATQTQDPNLVPGAVVELQGWYRDPPAPGTADLSNAMTVDLVP